MTAADSGRGESHESTGELGWKDVPTSAGRRHATALTGRGLDRVEQTAETALDVKTELAGRDLPAVTSERPIVPEEAVS
jgi:hypothetical protein